jgi:oligopeptide/dipeptide ABC transporter ATP-binding protein
MGALPDDLVLSVTGLTTHFPTEAGIVRSVQDVAMTLRRGETVAIVGESGSGKSVTCLSILGLVDLPGRVVAGKALFRRKSGEIVDLCALPEKAMRGVRGDDIAMIFQEPMTSLNPLFTVGDQIAEAIREHRGATRAEAWSAAESLLRQVGIADPELRVHDYPHMMSGGMRQRVMIAMALSCKPAVLIADEPTTALDVTIQAQILDLLRDLKASTAGMSIIFVTHNMGVVAEMADRVMVMYGGRVVEVGPVKELFARPKHPYTQGLLSSIARAGENRVAGGARKPLAAIPGNVPGPLQMPPGCAFAPRCALARDACKSAMPDLFQLSPDRATRCLFHEEL